MTSRIGRFARVRVFESTPPPDKIVKYIDSIVRYAPEDIAFSFFSWRKAILGRYDVFHVHWPEILVRGRGSLRSRIRRVLARLLLLRLRVFNTPVIRTVHNLDPHRSPSAVESRLLEHFDARVTRYVVMSDCPAKGRGTETTVIPHGDFRQVFAGYEKSERVGGRVLLFGRIEEYKGVFDLIAASKDISTDGVEIRIVGAARPEMHERVQAAIVETEGLGAKVTIDLRRVSDQEMITEMTDADLIALPYKDAGNGNSGVAMVALSLDRPVLVYRSCIMENLAAETSGEWVQMMDAPISGSQIDAALERAGAIPPDARPTFVGRDWQSVAEAYAEVFRAVKRGS